MEDAACMLVGCSIRFCKLMISQNFIHNSPYYTFSVRFKYRHCAGHLVNYLSCLYLNSFASLDLRQPTQQHKYETHLTFEFSDNDTE